jgi:hypothetical protein
MNTKIIEQTTLKNLRYLPELSGKSSNSKCFTRHWANLGLTASVDMYAMFGFVVFMSDSYGRIDYSLKLLKQYKQASIRAAEIYKAGKIKQSISIPSSRNLFIQMIEEGLLIRLESGKNRFMVNPLIVYSPKIRSYQKIQKDISKMILETGGELASVLYTYCQILDKDAIRYETESNKPKGR